METPEEPADHVDNPHAELELDEDEVTPEEAQKEDHPTPDRPSGRLGP